MITSYKEYIDLLDNGEGLIFRRAIEEAVLERVFARTIVERPDLKKWVILNKLVPENVLISLVGDPDPSTRSWVAKKRKLPMLYLEKLAYDSDDSVREEVVCHRKITRHILEILVQDKLLRIAKRAARRIEERDYRDQN